MNYNFKHLVISRFIAENLLLLLLQAMGMKFSVLSNPPLPVDFAAGTAAAFIFMRGYTILPGIWLGSFLACLLSGWTLSASNLLASGYALQTALFFFLCLRLVSPGLIFLTGKIFLRFALLCAFLALLFSQLLLSWQADLAGLLIVTLAITHWDMYFPEINEWRKLPGFITLASLFIFSLAINLAFSLHLFNYMNNIGLFIFFFGFLAIFSSIRRLNMK